MGTLTTLLRNALAFAYDENYKGTGQQIVYYCRPEGIYKYNLSTSTETTLSWPIASMACGGRTLLLNGARDKLYFIFTQNGLTGIGEYTLP